jgi:transcriptional regulator GlxA family with amidase domain
MKPIKVDILVTDRCQASGVFTVLDILIAANFIARREQNIQHDVFKLRLVGQSNQERAYNGYTISPLNEVTNSSSPDVFIIPGAFEAVFRVRW